MDKQRQCQRVICFCLPGDLLKNNHGSSLVAVPPGECSPPSKLADCHSSYLTGLMGFSRTGVGTYQLPTGLCKMILPLYRKLLAAKRPRVHPGIKSIFRNGQLSKAAHAHTTIHLTDFRENNFGFSSICRSDILPYTNDVFSTNWRYSFPFLLISLNYIWNGNWLCWC